MHQHESRRACAAQDLLPFRACHVWPCCGFECTTNVEGTDEEAGGTHTLLPAISRYILFAVLIDDNKEDRATMSYLARLLPLWLGSCQFACRSVDSVLILGACMEALRGFIGMAQHIVRHQLAMLRHVI